MFSEYSFIFDIDGTLCPIKRKEENYKDLVPYQDMVDKLKYYHENGAKIILFTSRNMNSYNGNLGKINKSTAKVLLDWLDKWDIPYDEIFYYIRQNIDDVQNDFALMISGEAVTAKIQEYAAVSMNLTTKNEIFSAMIVYGFLSYENGEVRIPNKELMNKFDDMIQG